jgi:hypothetical protein
MHKSSHLWIKLQKNFRFYTTPICETIQHIFLFSFICNWTKLRQCGFLLWKTRRGNWMRVRALSYRHVRFLRKQEIWGFFLNSERFLGKLSSNSHQITSYGPRSPHTEIPDFWVHCSLRPTYLITLPIVRRPWEKKCLKNFGLLGFGKFFFFSLIIPRRSFLLIWEWKKTYWSENKKWVYTTPNKIKGSGFWPYRSYGWRKCQLDLEY